MIEGVGIDLVEIGRVRRILQEGAGERFLERVLTPAERELASGKMARLAEFTAGRFAAKEAIVKAIGCGIGREVGFQDVEVLPDRAGKPICTLSPEARRNLSWPAEDAEVAHRIHISITHSESIAAAYAIVERVVR